MLKFIFIILNIVIILLFILIGGVIPLVERKYLSLIQRRVGPKFVGYNGRLQFLADALKILLKEIIYLININKILLITIPIILLNLNISLLIYLIWFNNIYLYNTSYFIFLLLVIEIITNFFLTIIGIFVKNKYTTIASTRLINGSIIFDIFIMSCFLILYIIHQSTSLEILNQKWFFDLKFINIVTLVPIFTYLVLINLKKVPFDLIEAETELIMGYSIEHSGFLAGSLLLIEYLHLFF